MRPGGLRERLRGTAARALWVLAGAAAAVLVLWAALWVRQVRRVSQEAEGYAEAEGLAAARALLYDLSEEADLKRLHRLEALYLETPEEARSGAPPAGLMDFVWGRLSLPDTALWEAARARGMAVGLGDVEAARAAVYRQEIQRISARLQEDLEARITFSEHLRGILLRSAGGAVALRAGEPAPALPAPAPRVSVSANLLVIRLPLYVESRHWGEAWLLMDRGPLRRLQGRLRATLGTAFAGLLALLGLFLIFIAAAWRWSFRTLQKEVVEPVALLHQKMEGWAREAEGAEGPVPDEPGRLGEVFDRMTRRIESQQQELLRVHRLALLERLGAALSHEMNNALNPALIRLDGLLLDGKGAASEDLRVLKGYLEGARKVLRDFAHATRGEGGPMGPVPSERWLGPALELARPAAEGAGVRLQGPEGGGPEVVGDAQSLVQVALNLLLNAVDAAAKGGKNVVVRFQEGVEGEALFTVADDGPGLPPEVREHLFEPFVTTKAQGTGLGLYVVDTLVRRMGGQITLVPREGGGTTARVALRRPTVKGGGP
ncbi:MAG: sensor histidine kinase [Acidobacteriota bacterium]